MHDKRLIEYGEFTLHSGRKSDFLINADALTDDQLEDLAFWYAMRYHFGSVEGVPTGGLRFAKHLHDYRTVGPLLIADDVCTTGASLIEQRAGREALGVVIFARGPVPTWVTPLFTAGIR